MTTTLHTSTKYFNSASLRCTGLIRFKIFPTGVEFEIWPRLRILIENDKGAYVSGFSSLDREESATKENKNASSASSSCISTSIVRYRFFQILLKMLTHLLRKLPATSMLQCQRVRLSSGIKLINEREKAAEDYYFSKQDGMRSNNIAKVHE